jgi:hypothetical protein
MAENIAPAVVRIFVSSSLSCTAERNQAGRVERPLLQDLPAGIPYAWRLAAS